MRSPQSFLVCFCCFCFVFVVVVFVVVVFVVVVVVVVDDDVVFVFDWLEGLQRREGTGRDLRKACSSSSQNCKIH